MKKSVLPTILSTLLVCTAVFARTEAQENSSAEGSEKKLRYLPELSGYVQTGYVWSEATSSFFVKRVRISLKGEAAHWCDYTLQAELYAPKLVDAYIRFKAAAAFNLQLGQFKTPFSIENTESPPLKLEFIEYPRVIERLVGLDDICGLRSTGRDMGAMLYGGFVERDGFHLFNYHFAVLNGNGINAKDPNKSKDIVVRLGIKPTAHLLLSGSYYRGEYFKEESIPHMRRERYAVGASFDDLRRWVARAEWLRGTTGTVRSEGWYAMAGYRISAHWMPALRYDTFRDDTSDASTRQSNLTAGVTYQPMKYLRCQLNYTYEDSERNRSGRNVVGIMVSGLF